MTRWWYASMNFSGNLHMAALFVRECHPYWDVITMSHSSGDGFGNTIIVYRLPRSFRVDDGQGKSCICELVAEGYELVAEVVDPKCPRHGKPR